MEERGGSVNHSKINRWAIRFLPLIEKLSIPLKLSMSVRQVFERDILRTRATVPPNATEPEVAKTTM
jgi:hypothetical protein